jgi:hypothetical protein
VPDQPDGSARVAQLAPCYLSSVACGIPTDPSWVAVNDEWIGTGVIQLVCTFFRLPQCVGAICRSRAVGLVNVVVGCDEFLGGGRTKSEFHPELLTEARCYVGRC